MQGVGSILSAKAPVAFSPIDIGPKYLWWAGGPRTLAASPTDDTTQQYLLDEMSVLDVAQATSTKRAKWKATTGPNGKQGWLFDGADDHYTGAITLSSSGWTLFAVAKILNADRALIGAAGGGPYIYQDGTNWQMQGGPNIGGHGGHATALDTAYHLFTAVCTPTVLTLEVDGVAQRSAQSGESPITSATINIGSLATNYYFHNSYIAMIGFYNGGDARGLGNWTTFENWCETEYGLTIA